jgi:lipopolysaccharide heptosyltransferase II
MTHGVEKLPFKVDSMLILFAGGLGDMLMFTPTLKAFKSAYPGARITIVAGKALYDIANSLGYFDKIFLRDSGFREQKVRTIYKRICLIIRLISFGRYDVLVAPMNLSPISLFVPAKTKIGFFSDNYTMFKKSLRIFLDYSYKLDHTKHDIEQHLKILSVLGITPIDKNTTFPVSELAVKKAESFLRQEGITNHGIMIGIHPVTKGMRGYNPKLWSKERFAQVAKRLATKYNAKIIVFGSKEEFSIAEEIAEKIGTSAIVQAGKTSIQTTAAILQDCSLLICNDAGLMHMAAALEVPTVAIFGPTHPRCTGYMGENHITLRKDLPCSPCRYRLDLQGCTDQKCLKLITADEVVGAACKILDRNL